MNFRIHKKQKQSSKTYSARVARERNLIRFQRIFLVSCYALTTILRYELSAQIASCVLHFVFVNFTRNSLFEFSRFTLKIKRLDTQRR